MAECAAPSRSATARREKLARKHSAEKRSSNILWYERTQTHLYVHTYHPNIYICLLKNDDGNNVCVCAYIRRARCKSRRKRVFECGVARCYKQRPKIQYGDVLWTFEGEGFRIMLFLFFRSPLKRYASLRRRYGGITVCIVAHVCAYSNTQSVVAQRRPDDFFFHVFRPEISFAARDTVARKSSVGNRSLTNYLDETRRFNRKYYPHKDKTQRTQNLSRWRWR